LLTQEKLITTEMKLEVIESITFESIGMFSKSLMEQMYFEGLVHGNMTINVLFFLKF
jgi:secreted Zn-dependent insulinase-like peptidase